ncbi:MAG: hypothetical protein WC838_06315, partial [Candidatus Margulisiibacteriota bacterium]
QNSGTALVDWYEKTGWLFGYRYDWRYSRTSFGNVRLKLHTREGLEGGITHRFLLTSPSNEEKPTNIIEQFFEFVPFSSKPFLEAQFDLSSGEIYDEDRDQQRVSFLPQITLQVPKQRSLIPDVDHEITFRLGNILEENLTDWRNSINRIRTQVAVQYSWQKNFFWDIGLGLKTGYDGRWYWDRTTLTNSWNLINGELSLAKRFDLLFADWSYYHNFAYSGGSAFAYDSKEAVIDDEIKYTLGLDLGPNTVYAQWRYNLMQKAYRDIDLSFKLNLHCWNLVLTWREIRKEFNFGVSLN